MKKWGWYLLVPIASALLITTFFTRNIFVVVGLFFIVMALDKFSKANINIPELYAKITKKEDGPPGRKKDVQKGKEEKSD